MLPAGTKSETLNKASVLDVGRTEAGGLRKAARAISLSQMNASVDLLANLRLRGERITNTPRVLYWFWLLQRAHGYLVAPVVSHPYLGRSFIGRLLRQPGSWADITVFREAQFITSL